MEQQSDEPADFRLLYPKMPAEELAEAEANFRLCIDDALRMYDRIRKDPIAYRNFRKTVAHLTLAREMKKLQQDEESGNDNNTIQES